MQVLPAAIAPGVLEAFGLYVLRTSAMVASSPLLGLRSGVSAYKIALIVALALVLFLAGGAQVPAALAAEREPILLGALALRELAIGVFLGFLMQLSFLAIAVAGQMIGHEMGLAMANQVDPMSGVPQPLITRIYETLLVLAMLGVDGHHWVLRALARSFEAAPVGVATWSGGIAETVQSSLAEMFRAGLTLAAPVLALLMLVSIVIGLLARVVPQLNILELGFTLRILIALVAMLAFAPMLAPALEALFEATTAALERGLVVLGG